MINVYQDKYNKWKWKTGSNYPKSVVITDFQIFDTDEIFGSVGWSAPEKLLEPIKKRFFQFTTLDKLALLETTRKINVIFRKIHSHLVD